MYYHDIYIYILYRSSSWETTPTDRAGEPCSSSLSFIGEEALLKGAPVTLKVPLKEAFVAWIWGIQYNPDMSIVKGKNWWCLYFLGATGYPILRQGLPSGYLLHSWKPWPNKHRWFVMPFTSMFTVHLKKTWWFSSLQSFASQALAKRFYVASLSWFQSLSQRWLWLKSGFRILHTHRDIHTHHISYL